MKEFKEIIDGIAHSLNMTVDSLVKAYPHLRTEYSWYYACTTVQIIFGVLFGLTLCGSVIAFLNWAWTANDYHSSEILCKRSFKNFAVISIITLIVFTVFLVASVLKGFTSPDVLIIDRVLNTITQGD
ncbi:hypothetical protein [Streptococcus gallolyticus]|uniref:hypothetical protein n=1 Tax=Streptococcus gallolyticus TaxID=315405 RepID=UPI0022842024|nr:hypothetical protein [Streptococcus gallolyticus]MCY7186397.1 hypothetical protein [Streptococcus gallolyticus subsp. gallolyticus]MCY7190544.1 hypothetical protein [Streptococcus gallolyticus subsp. gallolyticus]